MLADDCGLICDRSVGDAGWNLFSPEADFVEEVPQPDYWANFSNNWKCELGRRS